MIEAASALEKGGLVVILLAAIGFGVFGIVRGIVVPGWLYRQEREARLKAETQAERQTDALEELVAAQAQLVATVQGSLEDDRRRDARRA